MLSEHANLVEGDLRRVYGVRYSDRWRFDTDGTRKLTLREIWVYLEDLPNDSRIVKHLNDGRPRWGHLEYITSDVIHALTGKPYWNRPKTPKKLQGLDRRETPERSRIRAKRVAAKKRREMAGRKQRDATTTE